jgi:hypothetical protein
MPALVRKFMVRVVFFMAGSVEIGRASCRERVYASV